MTPLRRAFSGRLPRAISLPSLMFYVLTLFIGLAFILFTSLSQELRESTSIQHLGVFFVSFRIPISLDLLTPTLIAIAVYFSCFVVAFLNEGGYVNDLRGRNAGPPLRHRPNWLVVMPILSSSLLILVLLISKVQDSVGLPTGTLPSTSMLALFAALTTSPISEEVTFRLTTLGLVVGIRIVLTPKEQCSKKRNWKLLLWSLWAPDDAKTRAGLANVGSDGFRGIHSLEWAMLLVSSTIFGVSHIGQGSQWGPGKVTTATLSGLMIGLSFLIYGAYAAILLHWFFDYYIQFYSLLTNGILADHNQLGQGLANLNLLNYYWCFVIGVIGLLLLTSRVWKRESGEKDILPL